MDKLYPTASLEKGNSERAVKMLRRYFAPMDADGGGFTGGQWDTFDPDGDRASRVDGSSQARVEEV